MTGEIPDQVRNLVNLRLLDLSYNHLEGGVPDLEGLTRLTHLILDANNLTGIITPPPKLQHLSAGENFFTGLSPFFFQNSSLQQVNISWNRLEGPLAPPNTTVYVPELRFLDLSWNRLNGPIPRGFGDMMFHLDLSNNNLSGAIPSDLGTKYNEGVMEMQYETLLDLSGNKLSGEIPKRLLYRYETVNLSCNSLHGSIPDPCYVDHVRCEDNHILLYVMDLSDNKLQGHLPYNLTTIHSLNTLWLQNNNLSGDITDLLGNIVGELFSIRPQGNLFTGDLTPFFIKSSSFLQELDLSNNRFNMTPTPEKPNPLRLIFDYKIPPSFLSYWPITTIRLAGTNLLGLPLPELSAPRSLEVLDISSCNLGGRIPDSLNSSFPHLSTFNVSDNNLTGPIPEILPPSLQVLDIRNNHLEMGNVSSDLFQSLPNLLQFYASNNSLQGPIPDVLPRTSLQVLNLSHNQLQGRIPERLFFSLALLEDFDFSDNKLSGTIPPGLKASRFADNPELCGPSLRRCPTPGHRIVLVLCTVLGGVVLLSSTFCMVSAYR